LSVQTEKLGQAISGLLPEEQRGYYKQSWFFQENC
jgi:hypothetical protein